MNALVAGLSIFGVFTLIGLGVTALLPKSYSSSLRIRIAPGIGIGMFAIVALALSRYGLPVRAFATPLTITLALLSAGAIALRPPQLSWPNVAGVLGPVVAACILVGSPFFSYGYHWLSYTNGDMVYYCLSAERFEDAGYFEPPHEAYYLRERNKNEAAYGLDVNLGGRVGSNVLLAVAAIEFRRNPFEIFMPFIFAAFLTIVTGAGTLVSKPSGSLVPALISLTVAASPLAALGFFYQLLGQEYGLATSCALLGLFLTIACEPIERTPIGTSLVLGVAASGLLATYPEVVPFVGLAVLLFTLARRRDISLSRIIGVFATAILTVAIVLNSYALEMILFLLRTFLATSAGLEFGYLFPYYLVPSGLSNYWGLQPIAQFYGDPGQSVLIFIAILLCLLICFAAVVLLVRCTTIAAPMLIAFFAYAAYGAIEHQGFSLYKIAMYSQPFLAAVIVAALALFLERRHFGSNLTKKIVIIAPLLLLVGAWIPTEHYYEALSADQHVGPGVAFEHIPGASKNRLLVQLHELASVPRGRTVVSDASNAELGGMEAGYLRTSSLFFLSDDFFHARRFDDYGPLLDRFTQLKPLVRAPATAIALQRKRRRYFHVVSFNFAPHERDPSWETFAIDERADPVRDSNSMYLAMNADLSVLNRRMSNSSGTSLSMEPYGEISNRLTLVNSFHGLVDQPEADAQRVRLDRLEPDPYYHGRTMAQADRYHVFRITGTSRAVRLVLEVTSTLNSDGRNRIPLARAVGTTVASFHALGAGSARLISDPIVPVTIGHAAFVGVDMGPANIRFVTKRTGLMLLFGRSVSVDSPPIVGFVRDVSAIAADMPADRAPTSVTRFPLDLESKDLFYSGIYEDGWLSKSVRIRLQSTARHRRFRLRFEVPRIDDANFSSSVTISIDGTAIGTWPAPIGTSDIKAATLVSPGSHDVELRFSDVQQLPGLDHRPVGAALKAIAFD